MSYGNYFAQQNSTIKSISYIRKVSYRGLLLLFAEKNVNPCHSPLFASEDLSSPRGTKILEMPIFAKLGIRFIDHGMPLAITSHSGELLGPERRGICLDISVTRNDAPPAVRTSMSSQRSLRKISGNRSSMISGNQGPVRNATIPPAS